MKWSDTDCIHPKTAKWNNLNFHPLEDVSHYRDPLLQMGEKYSYSPNLGATVVIKAPHLVAPFLLWHDYIGSLSCFASLSPTVHTQSIYYRVITRYETALHPLMALKRDLLLVNRHRPNIAIFSKIASFALNAAGGDDWLKLNIRYLYDCWG